MLQILSYVLGTFFVLFALSLAIYATWSLVYRLRTGEPAGKSFVQWLKDLWQVAEGF